MQQSALISAYDFKNSTGLFNIMAKKITVYENDKIHSAKKRISDEPGKKNSRWSQNQ